MYKYTNQLGKQSMLKIRLIFSIIIKLISDLRLFN